MIEKIREIVYRIQELGSKQRLLESSIEASISEIEHDILVDEYNEVVRCKVALINTYEKLRNSPLRYIPRPPTD